jgi:MYXO-CTERM domain-containing protein
VSELGVTRRGSMSYAVLLEDHMDWIMSIIGEQSDWYAGWLEEQALNAALNEVAVETPAPGVGVALLGGVAIFARRRR